MPRLTKSGIVLKQVESAIAEHAAGQTIIVGVSGGPDSLTLLHTLVQLREEHQLKLVVVHVDHQLRGDAAREDASFVEQICKEWHVPSVIESVDVAAVAKEHGYTIEEAARRVRYTLFAQVAERHDTRWIAVGHNANDQAETVLMNLIRGSGLGGLTGMRIVSDLFPSAHCLPDTQEFAIKNILRPLLATPRADIEAYVEANNLTPRMDATNQSLEYTRNKIRHEVLPLLQAINPSVVDALNRTAISLNIDSDFINTHSPDWILDAMWKWGKKRVYMERAEFLGLHLAIQRRLLYGYSFGTSSFSQIKLAVEVAANADVGAKSQLGNWWLHVVHDGLLIADSETLPDPLWPLISDTYVIDEGRNKSVGSAEVSVKPYTDGLSGSLWEYYLENRWTAIISTPPPYTLRPRQTGDRFYPQGVGGSQTIKKFMNEAKIPAPWRDRVPLLLKGDDIVWVCGFRVDQRYIATEANQDNLWLVGFGWDA